MIALGRLYILSINPNDHSKKYITLQMISLVLFLYSFFFFFQAEDGIRDIGVTGVQTCALPILPRVTDGPSAFGTDGPASGPDGIWEVGGPRPRVSLGCDERCGHRPTESEGSDRKSVV